MGKSCHLSRGRVVAKTLETLQPDSLCGLCMDEILADNCIGLFSFSENRYNYATMKSTGLNVDCIFLDSRV